jgi:hypothetical protein
MGLFGLCPETDGFYAVICEVCEACVKPQGLVNHMGEYSLHNCKSVNKDMKYALSTFKLRCIVNIMNVRNSESSS